MTPRTLQTLETPSLIVDMPRLNRNLSDMQKVADSASVMLRPHIKTHKCMEIARRQIGLGAVGLTCAKLSEAEVMAEVTDNLFIAYPIVGETKWKRLDHLSEKSKTRISVECEEAAHQLERYLAGVGRTQDIMIKVETGLRRTGKELSELQSFFEEVARLRRLNPVGLFTHEGKAYGLFGREDMELLLDSIAEKLAEAKVLFHKVFGTKPIVSPGCTLTAPLVRADHGFDEIRPGTYVFKDTFCVESGIFRPEECALSVLVEIISVKSDGRVVVDGGSKTFAMDRHRERGHGFVIGHPDLRFDRLSEEHGVFETDFPDQYRVGQRIEVVPAHVCPAVNLHQRLFVRDGEEIVDEWRVDARGCVW